eukprot:202816-Rhodomonas_salina.1
MQIDDEETEYGVVAPETVVYTEVCFSSLIVDTLNCQMLKCFALEGGREGKRERGRERAAEANRPGERGERERERERGRDGERERERERERRREDRTSSTSALSCQLLRRRVLTWLTLAAGRPSGA